MKFDDSIDHFLKGEEFSNALQVTISKPERSIPLRMTYIETIVAQKNVIHLGFADHIPLIKKKIAKNSWFHKRLHECTKRCLGVDINKEAIEFVKTELGYTDILHIDILKDAPSKVITSAKWDYMIIGELLEHLDEPVNFLKNLKVKYAQYINHLIVTGPNALRIENYGNTKRHRELINSDHRFWFTPYTMAKIMFQAGITVESFQFCQGYPVAKHLISKKWKLMRYPAFRDTIVMTTKF